MAENAQGMDTWRALRLVDAMDAALLALLPLRELQVSDRHGADAADIERNARQFAASAKELELSFVRELHARRRRDRAGRLRQEIADLESELRAKDALVSKFEGLLSKWHRQQSSLSSTLHRDLRTV